MTYMSEDVVLIKRPEALYNIKNRSLSILTTFNDSKMFVPFPPYFISPLSTITQCPLKIDFEFT